MTKEVIERDPKTGEPTVIVFHESPKEAEARLAELREQKQRGEEVSESLQSA